jgi:aminopeptidase N
MLLTLSAALFLAASDDSLMTPGVSRELAEWRSRNVADVRYDLYVNLTNRDTAFGQVVIRFRRMGRDDAIIDFRGPSVTIAAVNGATTPVNAIVWNGSHIRIPARLLRVGTNEIRATFKARVAAAGTSIIRVRDVSDGADYLYTLLVPADAHALFPCFDQPDLKARVTLALATPVSWRAIANGPLQSSRIVPSTILIGGGDTSPTRATFHRFAPTRPISTYLIAFAAGPWTSWGTSHRWSMALYGRRSRAASVEADTLASMNAQALAWLSDYFARPYAFDKYEFVLAPAFPFGGMEHPGAVFYNEETFIFREPPTLTQRLGRQATTFHEVAHQWFGDLVTMRWFDDLWLKEGFATYMAAKMQDALSPDANAWKTFYLRNKPVAYDVDATLGTTPVWQELANLDQAKSNYGPIVYNKAPGILKQLEFLVGEQAFRSGVRSFLRRHAYGNATWRDLLDAIGTAAGRSLREWGEQYILRPGVPVIEQRVTIENGRITRLALVQRPSQPSLSGAGVWPVRLRVLLGDSIGGTQTIPVEIRAETTVVVAAVGRPAPAYVFANAGDHAYARVQLDARSIVWAERHVGELSDDLTRAMMWASLWDEVRDARLDPDRFIEAVLRELPRERDEQILAVLTGRLLRATDAYLSPARREARLAAVERVLLAGASDTTRPYGARKTQLDAYIAVASTAPALDRLAQWLSDTAVAGLPLRPPTRWAIVGSLVARGAPSATALLDAETRRDTTPDARRRAFVAGAGRPDSATKRDYFRRYFSDSTLNEEWATSSLRAFNDPRQSELTRPYLDAALDSLPWIQQNRRIFFLGQWLGAVLGGQTDGAALQAVDAFLARRSNLPRDLRQKILQARDELERTVRLRREFQNRTAIHHLHPPISALTLSM